MYYSKMNDKEMKCNICDITLNTDDKSLDLLAHVKEAHTEVYDLHRDNPEAIVGFRIEFLNVNVVKNVDDNTKTQPIIIGEVCETTEDIDDPVEDTKEIVIDPHIVVTAKKKKREHETRRKSWVWKYFECISNIIYRCTLCGAVLSIKGCNTNNMNRHVRTKHSDIYEREMTEKKIVEMDSIDESDIMLKDEELNMLETSSSSETKAQKQLQKRSWIWIYFDRITPTLAQCKLCRRNICHGGNATGNINRHLKMIHNKTRPDDHSWVWKVFDQNEDNFVCKICQFSCWKSAEKAKNITSILKHLKLDHGVVSGEQIITSAECHDEDI